MFSTITVTDVNFLLIFINGVEVKFHKMFCFHQYIMKKLATSAYLNSTVTSAQASMQCKKDAKIGACGVTTI